MKIASYVPKSTAAGFSPLLVASCLVGCSPGGHAEVSDASTEDGSVYASHDGGSFPHDPGLDDASIAAVLLTASVGSFNERLE